MENQISGLLKQGELYHPGFSIDCVIFGFHQNQLKVLLLKLRGVDKWALPGGFMYKNEDVEIAASRILKSRTGLEDIFLQQFHLFGKANRNDLNFNQQILKLNQILEEKAGWFLQRFITLGYYALVEFSKVIPIPDDLSEACEWFDLETIPELIHDHKEILNKALEVLRLQLNKQPIGFNLLPEKFTMPELQRLYETILGRSLDRRNFQRRVLAYGILKDLNERRSGVAHKAPYLYSFDLDNYHKALKEGLKGGW